MRIPPTPIISNQNLFQIHKYVPRSWRQPPPPTTESLINSIRSLSEKHDLSSAFAAFSLLLRRQDFSSSSLLHPISSLLSSSAALRAPRPGRQLHALAASLGLLHSRHLAARLVALYAALGLLADAHAAAQDSPSRSSLHWNILIAAYARARLWREAISAYEEVLAKGVAVDEFTFPSVVKACGEARELGLGVEIHGRIRGTSLELDLYVCNALVAMYAKCGALKVARQLFDGMTGRDVVSWNSMISAYASEGMWEAAFGLLDRMQAERVEANAVTWNSIVDGCLQMGRPMDALGLIAQKRRNGLALDSVSLVIGLEACSVIQSLRLGRVMHGLAIQLLYDQIDNVRNALITMYSSCNSSDCAYTLFCTTKDRSLISWNAMIAGFATQDRAEEAISIFREMVRCGMQPNDITLMSVLSLCARTASLHHGQVIHCNVVKYGLEGSQSLCNSLIDMYSKAQSLSSAQRVFDSMRSLDTISYTSLIAGYGMQRDGSTALDLFDEMIRCSLKPDHVTMVIVLAACAHSRLVSRGEELFGKMIREFDIVPRLEHFSCMVDLYCRAGLLKKAVEIIDHMTLCPSNAMLATLVKACLVHGNVKIALRAAQKLYMRKTNDPRHCVLIARLCERARLCV